MRTPIRTLPDEVLLLTLGYTCGTHNIFVHAGEFSEYSAPSIRNLPSLSLNAVFHYWRTLVTLIIHGIQMEQAKALCNFLDITFRVYGRPSQRVNLLSTLIPAASRWRSFTWTSISTLDLQLLQTACWAFLYCNSWSFHPSPICHILGHVFLN